jgi:hypothetical protein
MGPGPGREAVVAGDLRQAGGAGHTYQPPGGTLVARGLSVGPFVGLDPCGVNRRLDITFGRFPSVSARMSFRDYNSSLARSASAERSPFSSVTWAYSGCPIIRWIT